VVVVVVSDVNPMVLGLGVVWGRSSGLLFGKPTSNSSSESDSKSPANGGDIGWDGCGLSFLDQLGRRKPSRRRRPDNGEEGGSGGASCPLVGGAMAEFNSCWFSSRSLVVPPDVCRLFLVPMLRGEVVVGCSEEEEKCFFTLFIFFIS